jgi:hypothetical protein
MDTGIIGGVLKLDPFREYVLHLLPADTTT